MKYTHCIYCKQPFSAQNVFTEDGARETQLSQTCEKCFDDMFRDAEDKE